MRTQSFLLDTPDTTEAEEKGCFRTFVDFRDGVATGHIEAMRNDNYCSDITAFRVDEADFGVFVKTGGNRIIYYSDMMGADIHLRMYESPSVNDLTIFKKPKYVKNFYEYSLVFPNCTDIEYVGNPCNEEGGTCEMCQGDCDVDSDCAGDLRCAQRYYREHQVPGCLWPNGSNGLRRDDGDYCK